MDHYVAPPNIEIVVLYGRAAVIFENRRARDRASRAHPRPVADELPRAGVVPNRRARPAAVRPVSRGAARPAEPPTKADQPKRVHSELSHNDLSGRIAGARLLNSRAKTPRVVHDPG